MLFNQHILFRITRNREEKIMTFIYGHRYPEGLFAGTSVQMEQCFIHFFLLRKLRCEDSAQPSKSKQVVGCLERGECPEELER